VEVNVTTPARRFKDDVFSQLARVGKALSSPRRLELLDVLLQGPRTVDVLAARTAMSRANTSQHLRLLADARLVEARREGQFVWYRVAGPDVAALYLDLRGVAEARVPEVREMVRAFVDSQDTLAPTEAEELLRRALSGEVTVLDVRPAEEFAAGHLPGARSVPLEALAALLPSLPRDVPVVAYCRGPLCVLAVSAVARLRAAGFVAHRLDTGPPDWRRAGVALDPGGAGGPA
jgi:rhodanese-related sulfurtransferase/DNA-binding transcriptional ArsR family regulator